LNVQRDLGHGLATQVGYIGSRGTHLSNGDYDVNQFALTSGNSPSTYFWDNAAPRPTINPNFTQIYISRWNGVSFYHGLQVSLTKRMSHGLQVQANYTWSKSIDTNSIAFSSGGTLTGIANPYPLDPRVNRGPSDFNIPHNFVVNWLYNIPTPHWDSGIANAALKGWEAGGIFTASSGEPFSWLMLFDNPGSPFFGTGNGSHAFIGWVLGEKPDLVNTPACRDPYHVTKSRVGNQNQASYIDFADRLEPNPGFDSTLPVDPITNPVNVMMSEPTCFVGPGDTLNNPGRAGHLGNFGRNRARTAGLVNVDFSLYKNNYVKRISENFNVQLRFEFFNVFNHVNLGFPQLGSMWLFPRRPNVGNAGYTSTPARQIQMGVKINF
jgi:hypothetical protein